MKLTRRAMLVSAVAATATKTAAQTPPAGPAPVDPLKRSADAIAKVPLPQTTEPAFSFKA